MPSADDLKTLQDAIDQVVVTSAEIENTSNLLRSNIAYVATHNISEEAHPDIRAEVAKIPIAIEKPIISGPLTVESEEEYMITLTATPLLVGTRITKFKIIKSDDTVITIEEPQVINNSATVTIALVGDRFEKQVITFYAYDEVNNISPPTMVEYTITNNVAPDLTNLICNGLPLYANPGDTISISFSGATDIDIPYGDSLLYSISDTSLVFNQTSGIIENDYISFTLADDAERGSTVSFLVTAHDTKDGMATKSFSLKINQLPDISTLTCTLPNLVAKNTSTNFQLSGATDPDGHNIKYNIVSTDPHITFSKIENINPLEIVSIIVADSATAGSTIVFDVIAIDSYMGSSTRTFNTAKINQLPNITSLTTSIPTIIKPDSNIDFTISGAVDPEGLSLKYAITTNQPTITFTKNINIDNNETVTMFVPQDINRGTLVSITVTVTDSVGATVNKIFTTRINTLPDITNINSTLPEYIKPNGSYNFKISGVNDVDGQLISYAIITDDPTNIVLNKSFDLNVDEEITITVNNNVLRGNIVSFTCLITDGLEVVPKIFTTRINMLPSNVLAHNIPDYIKPNSTYDLTFDSNEFDEQEITYTLLANDTHVAFNPSTNIHPDDPVQMNVTNDVLRGKSIDILVDISDGVETIQKTITTKVNQLPINDLIHTIPTFLIPGENTTCVFTSTEPDGQALTYTVISLHPKVTLSKTTGISPNESVTIFTSDDIVRGDAVLFKVTIFDGMESIDINVTSHAYVLPDMTNTQINTLPTIVKPNTPYMVNINGTENDSGVPLVYDISSNAPEGMITFTKASGLSDGESFQITTNTNISRGSTVTFTVKAHGLETVEKMFDVYVNTLPNMSDINFNLPNIIKPNTMYNDVTLTGITDTSGGQTLTYGITVNDGSITISKSTGITEGEIFTITTGNVTRGNTVNFTIIGSDGLEYSAPTIKQSIVNTLPILTGLHFDVPSIVKPNSTHTVTVIGAIDTTLTIPGIVYSIAANDPKVTFSKDINIANGENIDVSFAADIVRGSTITFTVTTFDGLETNTKEYYSVINTLPSIGISHNVPDLLIPGQNYPITIISTDMDIVQDLHYSISSNNTGITFSKSTDITSGETFTMLVANNIDRGTPITLTVTISDGLETTNMTITTEANTLPIATDVIINNLPFIVKPNFDYEISLNGGSDINSQTLKYAIVSSDLSVNFSKVNDIDPGESIIVNFTNTTRGSAVTFTVTVMDGLESVNKTLVYEVNTIPNMTAISYSLPNIIKPNATYSTKLNGITDTHAQPLTYSIVCNDPTITFSKSTDLTSNEPFDTIISNTARNTNPTFTITGSDGLETNQHIRGTLINNLPDLSALNINNLPTICIPNEDYTLNITGATDINSSTLTYTIQTVNPNISFSKSTGLIEGETFTMSIGSGIIRGENIYFTVIASDGLESAFKDTFTTYINTLPDMTNVTAVIPEYFAPNITLNNVHISGITDITPGQTNLKYIITCDNSDISFSKSTDLINGENFDIHVGNIVRGSTITFTITGSDGLETSSKTISSIINHLPSNIVTINNFPQYVIPGQTVDMNITSVDVDNQNLTYDISADNLNVSFSKSEKLVPNETFMMTITETIPLGTIVTFTVDISDGVESISITKTFKVNQLPIITDMVLNLPTIVKPNSTVPFSISGATDPDGQVLTYSIVSSDPKFTFSKDNNILENEALTVSIDSDVIRGSTVIFTVSVHDGYITKDKTFPITVNTLPEGIIIENLPEILVPGQDYNVSVSSIDEQSNQTLTYSITSDDINVHFSKSAGIAINEVFAITPQVGITRGKTIIFTVTIFDGLEYNTDTFTAAINTLPIGDLVAGIPSIVAPGTVTPLSFSGFNDPNGTAILYSIVCNDPKVSFSKTTDIAPDEEITMTVTNDITRGSSPNITIFASDGLESTPSPMGVLINVLPNMSNVILNTPNIVKPNTSYTSTLSGMTDVTVIGGLTYSISCNTVGVSFSKNTGLMHNESFDVIIGDIAENTTLIFTIIGNDGIETSSITKTIKINNTPVITNLITTIPSIVKPNSTVPFSISGATDPDGQVLTYSISSNKLYATFSKNIGIASGESINLIIGESATRGEIITVTVAVSDGLTTINKVFTTKINTLPSTAITHNVVPYLVPGATYSISATATDIDNQTLKMSIVPSTTKVILSKSTDITSGENISLSVASDATRGSTITFTVTISDGLETVNTTFTSIINTVPNASGAVINNLPPIIKPGGIYTLNITGGSSSDAGQSVVEYGLYANDANITFSHDFNTTAIPGGQSFTMTVGNNITRNTTVSFTIVVSDYCEVATKIVTSLVNSLPDLSSAIFNLPNYLVPLGSGNSGWGGIYSGCKISGITDINSTNQTITYNISTTYPNIGFSKSLNLINDETFNITIPNSAVRGDTITFTVTATDGLETTTKTFVRKINTYPIAPTVTGIITTITGNNSMTVSMTGGADGVDTDQIRGYYIWFIDGAGLTGLSISKNYEILPNENITIYFPKVAVDTVVTLGIATYEHCFDTSNNWAINDWSIVGGVSVNQYNITIKPHYIIATPSITYPASNAVLTSDAVTFTFDAINVAVDI